MARSQSKRKMGQESRRAEELTELLLVVVAGRVSRARKAEIKPVNGGRNVVVLVGKYCVVDCLRLKDQSVSQRGGRRKGNANRMKCYNGISYPSSLLLLRMLLLHWRWLFIPVHDHDIPTIAEAFRCVAFKGAAKQKPLLRATYKGHSTGHSASSDGRF